MNIAVTPTHRTEARAEIRARHVDQRFAKSGSSGLIANQWRKDVALFQKQPARDADSFLALTDIDAAGDLTAAVETHQLLLKRAGQQHPAKRLEKPLMRRHAFARSSFAQRCGRGLFSF